MRWSFSRLNSFDNGCKYEWYQHYIECQPSEPGFFAQFGGFCHSVIEKYAKGELSVFDISQYYEENFAEEVSCDAPMNKFTDLKSDYYNKGLEYFDNIDLPINKYQVLGVEKQVEFNLDKYPFIGFIDLLLKDPEDGKLILCDHKSSTIKKLKSGAISKSDQQHFLEFKRQQYLYSLPIIEEFGEGCIKELWWNLFKDRDWIRIQFDNTEYQEAQDWALDTIHRIENEKEWDLSPDFISSVNDGKYPPFYCMNSCSQRYKCSEKLRYVDILTNRMNNI